VAATPVAFVTTYTVKSELSTNTIGDVAKLVVTPLPAYVFRLSSLETVIAVSYQ
jgi:hypothetical protein